jgi:hypothetical protein
VAVTQHSWLPPWQFSTLSDCQKAMSAGVMYFETFVGSLAVEMLPYERQKDPRVLAPLDACCRVAFRVAFVASLCGISFRAAWVRSCESVSNKTAVVRCAG